MRPSTCFLLCPISSICSTCLSLRCSTITVTPLTCAPAVIFSLCSGSRPYLCLCPAPGFICLNLPAFPSCPDSLSSPSPLSSGLSRLFWFRPRINSLVGEFGSVGNPTSVSGTLSYGRSGVASD
ncbi:hypothetical protein ATANTOWER_005557 [Ataeniobius toweri]|uniref:Secreted protein n=1 Tax=Ataeniobius toweri TaxID=208326 RepID=A0ABU7ADE3_9TELE|nr:hypothetical protein [Ataeniobius toweri]